jgi:hypothetical protein
MATTLKRSFVASSGRVVGDERTSSSRLPVSIVALVAWFGVLLQCYLTLHSAISNGRGFGGGVVIFLGYFTILTNLLVCAAATASALAPQSRAGIFFSRPEIVFGIAASILFVAISYHLLLRHVWNPQGLHLLANDLLHYLTPVLYVIYWWLAVPKSPLRWTHLLWWGLYPTLYLVYVLIRGPLVNGYPYAFIDAGVIGYQRTMMNGFGLLFAFYAIGAVLLLLSRRQKSLPFRASR